MRLRALLLASGFLLLASATACGRLGGGVPAGETRRETKTVDLDGSASTRVDIKMGAGELRVKSGTPKLLDAAFTYNVDEWKPVVDYRPGQLTISQPKGSGASFSKTIYEWDLTLNGDVPMDVNADLGAGEANLEFGGLNLRSVEVHVGAGEVKLDLRGQPKQSYNVRAGGGVGAATIYLPKDVAISATVTGGIGSIDASGLEKRNGVWINPDKPQGPITITLDVKGGVGEIKLIR